MTLQSAFGIDDSVASGAVDLFAPDGTDDVYAATALSFHPSMVQVAKDGAQDMFAVQKQGGNSSGQGGGTILSRAKWNATVAALRPMLETPDNNQMPTLVFFTFVSERNVALLQLRIRRAVFRRTHLKIGMQSQEGLLALMQNAYTAYAENTTEVGASLRHVFFFVRREVARLNNIVVDSAFDDIIGNLASYRAYRVQRDITQRELPDHPVFSALTGEKSKLIDISRGISDDAASGIGGL